MRHLKYAINHTIDGFFNHTDTVADDELLAYYTRIVQEADLIVYGRKTYEIMIPYWPDVAKNYFHETKADVDFARAFCAVNKIVFSHTLRKAEDENTRVVSTSLKDEIIKLKQEAGKNILTGGIEIPSQLIALDLIDEYYFVVQPIIAGSGQRLLDGINLQQKLHLKLAESTVLKSGAVALHYVKE